MISTLQMHTHSEFGAVVVVVVVVVVAVDDDFVEINLFPSTLDISRT